MLHRRLERSRHARWHGHEVALGGRNAARPSCLTDKPNLITGPVQVCWRKFARYWDVELREIPMEEGRLLMTPEEVIVRCDENTIGVVPTLRRHLQRQV